jgi:hypothetical protein
MAQNFIQFRKTMARLDAQLKREEAERKMKRESKKRDKKEKNNG